MPDTPSPFDDPLADLYGRLPDQRRRASEDAPAGSSEAGAASSGEGVPLSRREARAARENTDTPPITRPAAPATGAPREPSRPATPPAPAAPPVTAAPPAGPAAPARTSIPQAAPVRTASASAGPRPTASAASTRPGGSAPAGTLEDLFTGERSSDEMGALPPKKKRRRRAAGWIALAVVLVLVGGVALAGVWAANTFGPRIEGFFAGTSVDDFEEGMANGETQITIISGDAGPQVAQKAFDAGATKTASTLYDYMIENSVAFTFQPGVYRLQLQMTSPAVLDALRNPENRLENTAQLREGLTVETSIQAISEQMGMPIEDLQAAVADPAAYGVSAQNLEGWIFPATYTFDPDATASQVIQTMVNRTIESLDAAGVPVDDRERVLTVASIIEREGRTPDFPKVSRVIQNRLDQGMRLQMDSTAQYGYGELHAGSASTSEEAQYDDNAWNTYVIDGLPATPIANPGDAAIDAAMHPEEGPWLFFVTVNLDTGETVFTTNADDHQAAVDQWVSWCRDNPDSGC
jgi:UPF0755 protein